MIPSPNKLNVVDPHSNFHPVWWKTWSDFFLTNPNNFGFRAINPQTRKSGKKEHTPPPPPIARISFYIKGTYMTKRTTYEK
jgi:hypothetical protein